MSINKNLSYLFLFICCFMPNKTVLAAQSTWQGSYLGAYLGGAFGHNYTAADVGTVTDSSYFSTSTNINAVNDTGTSAQNPNAFIGGIQAGHDWAWKRMVYGVALDFGSFSLNGSNERNNVLYPASTDTYSIKTSIQSDWLLTLRGRLGFETRMHWPSLFYTTAGMAISKLQINNNFSDNTTLAGAGNIHDNIDEIGWTAGLGVDVAAMKNLFLNIEYLYVDIPTVVTTGSISNTAAGFGILIGSQTSPFTTNNYLHANLLKLGLNYHFNA